MQVVFIWRLYWFINQERVTEVRPLFTKWSLCAGDCSTLGWPLFKGMTVFVNKMTTIDLIKPDKENSSRQEMGIWRGLFTNDKLFLFLFWLISATVSSLTSPTSSVNQQQKNYLFGMENIENTIKSAKVTGYGRFHILW